MGWLNPAAAWWLLTLPALLGLYMLRPRAQRSRVSSLRLWQALPQVDRPRVRLRRPPLSLLLLLQALLLTAGAVALIQPALSAPAPRFMTIIVDASGSMQAVSGQSSRFEQAKDEARRLAGSLAPDDKATLLRAGEDVATACSSCNRGDLDRAINDLRPGAGGSNLGLALRVAKALSGRSAEGQYDSYVISDGGFSLASAQDLPSSLHFRQVGKEAGNQAITVLSARRPPDGSPGYSVYARVVNWSGSPASVDVSSLADTVPLPRRHLDMPANGHADLVWQLPAGTARFSLALASQDALPADDNATLYLPVEGQYTVSIKAADPALYTRVLAGVPSFSLGASAGKTATPGPVAFSIIEGSVPADLPAGNLLLVNASGGFLAAKGELSDVQPQVLGTDHPLLAGVDISPLVVDKAHLVEPASWLEPVIQSDKGPLLLAGEHDGRRIAALTFDPRDSNLPKLVAFPLLMSNLVDWLYPLAATQSIRPGGPVYLSPASVVTAPDGHNSTVGTNGLYVATDQVGIYKVSGGAFPSPISFAVNMTNEQESNLAIGAHPELERTAPVTAGKPVVREYWSPLALLSLLLVGAEWLFYCWRKGRS